MTISMPVSRATGISTAWPRADSMRAGSEPESFSFMLTLRSGNRAGEFFQHRPGLLAIFAAPLLVEARGLQLGAEQGGIDLDEFQALGGELGLQAVVELSD